MTKLNALNFADEKLNVASMMISRLDTVYIGDTVGKAEKCWLPLWDWEKNTVNSLSSNDKILDMTKLKAFADDH